MARINVDRIKLALAIIMLQEMATDEDVIVRYDPNSGLWAVLPPGEPGGRHTDLADAIMNAYAPKEEETPRHK